MDIERLLNLIHVLVDGEDQQEIQRRLDGLVGLLNGWASSPQDTQAQVHLSEKLNELENLLLKLEQAYSAATIRRMDEIGATQYFTTYMSKRIREALTDNALTPAVVRDEIKALAQERNKFVARIRSLSKNLSELGFKQDDLKEDQAQIGFELPRELFQNELGGLTKELNELRQIIRAFSELAGNHGEPIGVRQISTTDPIFFFALGLVTIRLLGGAIKWSLETWKTVEEIRRLRQQTAKLNGAATAMLVAQFDEAIRNTVEAAVHAEAERLVGPAEAQAGRRNEMLTSITMALHGILARVERGMTVELRLALPSAPEVKGNEESTSNGPSEQAFRELKEIQRQLVFPERSSAPVLSIGKAGSPGGKPSPTDS